MHERVFVIGANSYGECGVNNGSQNLLQLTDLTQANKHLATSIKHIYNGNEYTVYRDHNNTLWTSGHNKHFSCCTLEKSEQIHTLKEIDYFYSKTEDNSTITDNQHKSKGKSSKYKNKRDYKHKKNKKKTKNTKTDDGEEKKVNETSKLHKINIKKICISVSGYCTFFISQNNKVYGNGNNRKYQLGYSTKESEWWTKGYRYKCEPKQITAICKNLIDLKSCSNYSLALRMSDKAVMFLYCNRSKYNVGLQLHEDVFRLIVAYVGKLSDEDCAVYIAGNGRFGWKAIAKFMGKDIIKIECGVQHSLALESNGVLWSWGNNRYLQCGHTSLKSIKYPMEITYFKDNNIKIKDMKCGWNHCLVIDRVGRVYAFGRNNYAQCGYDVDDASDVQLIDKLKNYKVRSIECGSNHCYVKTICGKHFLFGNNNVNQCITYDERKCVVDPCCINQIIKEKTNGIIKKVTLGVDNTQIIVSITSDQ